MKQQTEKLLDILSAKTKEQVEFLLSEPARSIIH